MSAELIGFAGALRRQLKLLTLSGRPILLLGVASALGCIVGIASRPSASGFSPETFTAEALPLLLILSGAWGIVVWRDEPPSRRIYHYSLPVRAVIHDLARVSAGAVWLIGSGLLYWISSFVTMSIGTMASPQPDWLLLAACTSGPAIIYLCTASVATFSGHPFEWVLGIWIGFSMATVLAAKAGILFLSRLSDLVVGAPYGLGFALSYGSALVRGRLGVTDPAYGISTWLTTSAAWLLVALTFTIGAAVLRFRRGTQ